LGSSLTVKSDSIHVHAIVILFTKNATQKETLPRTWPAKWAKWAKWERGWRGERATFRDALPTRSRRRARPIARPARSTAACIRPFLAGSGRGRGHLAHRIRQHHCLWHRRSAVLRCGPLAAVGRGRWLQPARLRGHPPPRMLTPLPPHCHLHRPRRLPTIPRYPSHASCPFHLSSQMPAIDATDNAVRPQYELDGLHFRILRNMLLLSTTAYRLRAVSELRAMDCVRVRVRIAMSARFFGCFPGDSDGFSPVHTRSDGMPCRQNACNERQCNYAVSFIYHFRPLTLLLVQISK
jgi:hypothetical protein